MYSIFSINTCFLKLNKKNDLKAQLTDSGFKQERHKSLLKIPVEVLIPAINATNKN
jgi:hypothetical protein